MGGQILPFFRVFFLRLLFLVLGIESMQLFQSKFQKCQERILSLIESLLSQFCMF